MDLGDPRVDANIAACEQGLRKAAAHRARGCVLLRLQRPWRVGGGGREPRRAGPGSADRRYRAFLRVVGGADRGLGRRVVRTPWREGWPIDAAAVEQALRDDKRPRNPGRVRRAHRHRERRDERHRRDASRIDAARHPALLVADVVASLGAAPFAMDALGVDVSVGASQKGLMCPPGVGFVAVNARALGRCREKPCAALLLGLGAAQGRAVVSQVLRHAATESVVRPRGSAGADLSRRFDGGVGAPRQARRCGARGGRGLARRRRGGLLRRKSRPAARCR